MCSLTTFGLHVFLSWRNFEMGWEPRCESSERFGSGGSPREACFRIKRKLNMSRRGGGKEEEGRAGQGRARYQGRQLLDSLMQDIAEPAE